MGRYGIDISEHNGNIDLSKYKDQFVIIRAGWGLGHLDKKYRRNVKECERLGIKFGVYWYSYALDDRTAEKEAVSFIDIIKGDNVQLGAWLDMEDADGWKKRQGWAPTKRGVSDIVVRFCGKVEEAGFYTGVYLSYSWLQYLDNNTIPFDRWVAHWGTNDGGMHGDYKRYGSIHQYTSIPLDKDYFYKESYPNPGDKTKPVKTTDELVKEVLKGKYGTGDERKKKLGRRYNEVQRRVNEVLRLARKAVNGDYGNGAVRKKKLGKDYEIVQWVINSGRYK